MLFATIVAMKIDGRLAEISDCLYRVSLKVIIIQNARLLLVIEDKAWHGLPGGGLDYGESIEAALERELYEELAIVPGQCVVDTSQPVLVTSGQSVNAIPYCNIYYWATLSDRSLELSAELTSVWVDKTELSTIHFGPTIELARSYLENLL
jgi:8-oxo-dGTP pyrophosphatase MutT (NUDIX family)